MRVRRLRVGELEWRSYGVAAEAEGLSVSAWLRRAARDALQQEAVLRRLELGEAREVGL